ncbi:MAG: MauE/DoxX family redox-associated membrane protein [Gilvibacter sp.]
MNFPWHQYLLAVIFIAGGANHIRIPKLYKKVMPPYLPSHDFLVGLTGVLEMVAGFMLITAKSQQIGAYIIIVLLILFFTVHIHMIMQKEARLKLPLWLLWLRIPIQFGLIYWASFYI